jgi:hypothetical protein
MSDPIYLSELEFHRLLESNALPTRTATGKRWKVRRWNDDSSWSMGEYVDIRSDSHVGIRWRPIVVLNSSYAFEVVLRRMTPWVWS